MEALNNIRLFATILIVALFTGCAGITEANLSDTNPSDAPAVSAESPLQSTEAPGYFHGGDDPEMLDLEPSNDQRDRE